LLAAGVSTRERHPRGDGPLKPLLLRSAFLLLPSQSEDFHFILVLVVALVETFGEESLAAP
jgi:hypothetical protein